MTVKIFEILSCIALAGASSAITALLYNYYHRERNEAIFFYGVQPVCYHHSYITKYTRSKHPDDNCYICKLHIIIGWINEAKKTLDICIYMVNQELLLIAIMGAHKRGVHIRLITDDYNAQIWELSMMGINQKMKIKKYANNLMHHKFVIIDGKQLITGSLNWTKLAVRNNWENVFISNEHKMVESFKEEFEKIWNVFDWN